MNLIQNNPDIATLLLLAMLMSLYSLYKAVKRHYTEIKFKEQYEYYEAERAKLVESGLLPEIDWDAMDREFLVDKSPK